MISDTPVVALNAQLASNASSYRSAGISGYIVKLLQHLPEDTGVRYVVLTGNGDLADHLTLPVYQSNWSTERPIARILWEQFRLPQMLRELNADLLHAPAFGGPLLSSVPHVDTVHDLSFLRHPQFFRSHKRFYLRLLTRWSCQRAAAVIAVSAFTAREVVALLDVPKARVHVIHHGVEPRFHPLPDKTVAEFRTRHHLPQRYILYLGTLEPRKNLVTLLQAYAGLHETDAHLVLAGGQGWLYEDIFAEVERLNLENRVHFPGYLPDDELPLWYNAADVFAYVSWYEGFGLPILEAMACGTPVVASSTTSLPEVAGDAALLVSPDDVDAVSEGLKQCLDDRALHTRLRQAGQERAARFRWQTTAQHTTDLYKMMLGVS